MKKHQLIAVSLLALYGCDNQNTTSEGAQQVEVDSTEIIFKEAKTRFEVNCSGCHGEQMQAFVDRKWKYGNSEDSIFKSIKYGHPEEGMPPFQNAFTDEQISELVSYIKFGLERVDEYKFEEDAALPAIHHTEEFSFKLDTLVGGLKIPWGMAFLPENGVLITDREGKLYRYSENEGLQEVAGAPQVLAKGQGGMLDVAIDPEFTDNAQVYLSYSIIKDSAGQRLSSTAVMKATLKGNTLADQKIIFEAEPYSTKRHHYGSRLAFGKDGLLYITVGDRGNRDENPQSLERSPGKIHRIKPDGSIPEDNPFVEQPKAIASIYSYGHRNPQGLVFHPETGELWEHEHGPRGGDELNIVKKGENYGWPVISYGINYDGTIFTNKTEMENMEQPISYWVPSIAPSGMIFVTGDRYKGWKGNLLVGSLRFKFLNRCVIKDGKIISEEKLLKNIGRVRDVELAPDGYIYVAVEDPGTIYKLVPVEVAN